MAKSNEKIDVFKFINTHGNDPDVCWEWTGSTAGRDERGYFSVNKKKYIAYRLVYELYNGHEIQPDLVVRHRCDNPQCCNPAHLEIGTRAENEKDKYKRDRSGYTHDMIKDMHRFFKLGMNYSKIADAINAKYATNVTRQGVTRVIKGETRAGDVDDE